MKFFCLVNPVSGGKKGRYLLDRLQSAKSNDKFEGEIEELNQKDLKSQLKRAYTHDRILIAGGDGTISEVICALDENAPPLGLLPLGTGNDLAKELNIYKHFSLGNPLEMLNYYKTADSEEVTVWKLLYGPDYNQSVKFINYISFGMDAGIVNRFSRWRKSFLYRPFSLFGKYGNRAGYAAAGLTYIFNRLKISGVKFKGDEAELNITGNNCLSLIFANIRSMMGLGISNLYGSYFDDKIELLTTTSALNYLSMILRLQGPFPPPVLHGSACEWTIENLPENTCLQIDGEGRADIKSTNFKIKTSGKVRILCA